MTVLLHNNNIMMCTVCITQKHHANSSFPRQGTRKSMKASLNLVRARDRPGIQLLHRPITSGIVFSPLFTSFIHA